jgi:hypothetical protein
MTMGQASGNVASVDSKKLAIALNQTRTFFLTLLANAGGGRTVTSHVVTQS